MYSTHYWSTVLAHQRLYTIDLCSLRSQNNPDTYLISDTLLNIQSARNIFGVSVNVIVNIGSTLMQLNYQ